jgi:hypothetical protein
MIARSGTLAILLLVGLQIAWSMGHRVARLLLVRDFPAYQMAKELRRVGVGTGDRVACIGDTPGNHYWAHLAGVIIVAEVPVDGVSSFIASSPERKARTLSALAQDGVKIIVARDLPPQLAGDGWQAIANTDYSIFVLHK